MIWLRQTLTGSTPIIIHNNITTPQGIALDIEAQKVYWVDHAGDAISRSNTNGTESEDLITGLQEEPFALALNTNLQQLYWTETWNNDRIRRCSYNCGTPEDLICTGIEYPQDVALDFLNGRIYWADSVPGSGTGKIQYANIDLPAGEDCSNRSDIVTVLPSLSNPRGIAIDPSSGTIYWSDGIEGAIYRANLDGTGVASVVQGLSEPVGIALDLRGNPVPTASPWGVLILTALMLGAGSVLIGKHSRLPART